MSGPAASTEAAGARGFRPWEWALLVLAAPTFVAALAMYTTDFPILRRYLFKMELATPVGTRVGRLGSATGRVRRQRATESEFVAITVDDAVQNEDTLVTDPGTSATVLLDDGGRIELASDTMVRLAFDTKISIGGITRQANVELVTGAVSGETKKERIVVKTATGATTTIGAAAAATVVREEPVVPKKVEAAPAQAPVEVVEAKLPAQIEIPREEPRAVEPPPVPPPKPRILPATLSELNPPAGAKLAPGAGNGSLAVRLSFASSRPQGRFRIRLKSADSWFGGRLLDELAEARDGKAGFPVTIDKPGRYEWSVEDLDAESALGSFAFEVTPDFEGITLLDTEIPGSRGTTNQLSKDVLTGFPGFQLRWKEKEGAEDYEVRVFTGGASRRLLHTEGVSGPELLFSRGRLIPEPLEYRVVAKLKNGFRASSPVGRFQFNFLPPALSRPRNGAEVVAGAKAPVLLTWQLANFTDRYEVEVAADPAFSEVLKTEKTAENFLAFQPGRKGTFYWRVRALSGEVRSASGAARSFTVR